MSTSMAIADSNYYRIYETIYGDKPPIFKFKEHSINHKTKIPRNGMLQGISLGDRWDSNPRHSEPQSDALTN